MEKGFEKALEIYSVLATGQSISAKDKETAELYNSFYSDSEVYDAVNIMNQSLLLQELVTRSLDIPTMI